MVAAIIAAVIGGLALVAGAFVLSVWGIVWNVSDIVEHGVSFWNVFWLFLIGVGWFGGISGATK